MALKKKKKKKVQVNTDHNESFLSILKRNIFQLSRSKTSHQTVILNDEQRNKMCTALRIKCQIIFQNVYTEFWKLNYN